ncbi:MAG: hypothetical protein KAR65_09125, partial [Anaerolineales bacterium]|nr:hypothetical protein [Anaerolineales bacterium]
WSVCQVEGVCLRAVGHGTPLPWLGAAYVVFKRANFRLAVLPIMIGGGSRQSIVEDVISRPDKLRPFWILYPPV